MGREQFEIRAGLAQRVEGVFVEEAEGPFGQRLNLARKDFREGGNRVFLRSTGEMLA